MNLTDERKLRIISYIKTNKITTSQNLAEHLGVSIRTVRTYIQYLKLIYPNNLIIKRGRANGGIYWEEIKIMESDLI